MALVVVVSKTPPIKYVLTRAVVYLSHLLKRRRTNKVCNKRTTHCYPSSNSRHLSTPRLHHNLRGESGLDRAPITAIRLGQILLLTYTADKHGALSTTLWARRHFCQSTLRTLICNVATLAGNLRTVQVLLTQVNLSHHQRLHQVLQSHSLKVRHRRHGQGLQAVIRLHGRVLSRHLHRQLSRRRKCNRYCIKRQHLGNGLPRRQLDLARLQHTRMAACRHRSTPVYRHLWLDSRLMELLVANNQASSVNGPYRLFLPDLSLLSRNMATSPLLRCIIVHPSQQVHLQLLKHHRKSRHQDPIPSQV